MIKDEYSARQPGFDRNAERTGSKAGDMMCSAVTAPLEPKNKPEHLLIPELGLGFVTQNSYIEFLAHITE